VSDIDFTSNKLGDFMNDEPSLLPPLTASIAIVADRDRYKAQRDKLRAALEEVEIYLDDRADVVDGPYGEPAPNKEMSLLQEVREALSQVKP